MITPKLVLLIAVFASLGGASSPVQQPQCNTIIGRVTTVDGRVLTDAIIMAKNTKTKKVEEAHSDRKGEYSLCLLPGTYDLSVTKVGFLPQKRKSLCIDLVSGCVVDFVLKFRQL